MDLTPTIIEAPSEGAAAPSPAEPSAASSPEAPASTSSDETQITQGSATETTATESAADDGAATPEGEKSGQDQEQSSTDPQTDRLDKHPRFKQVVTERRQFKEALDAERIARAQLEGRLQALETAQQQTKPVAPNVDYDAELAAIDRKLEKGDIDLSQARAMERKLNEARFSEQVLAFKEQVSQQAATERQATAEQAKAAAEQAKVDALADQFIKANPDFLELQESGEIADFLKQNPLHDNVSAYYALKAQKADAAHKAELDAAVKAAEEKVRKDFAAKQSAKTLTGSTSSPPAAPNGPDPELANPEKYGGINAVLARRLVARRSAGS